LNIFVEGYGCSMNFAETEEIKGHAIKNGFSLSSEKDADFIVINTCAVKEQTELNMLRRIKELNEISEKNNSILIVFGCLSKISPEKVNRISEKIILIGPDLEKLSKVLKIKKQEFSPEVDRVRYNKFVTIIPICSGCTNNCSFCATKFARGKIKSFSIKEIKNQFVSSLNETKEFWLTGQDTGAYGLDINTSLPELIKELLKVEGEYRIRIGMMNPHHLKRIYSELIPLFKDSRLYNFLHLPVQSGSDRILKLMRRTYTSSDYIELVKKLRKDIPNVSIANDFIVGFPSETNEEFLETVSLVEKTTPNIFNISRFGARPGTDAEKMKEQISGSVKKERSRKLTTLCRKVCFEENKKLVGLKERVFVSDKGKNNTFIGRSFNYKQVIIDKNLLGKFVNIQISEAFTLYLKGKVLFD